MVSFFGLKFGADKRKKSTPDAPPQPPLPWNGLGQNPVFGSNPFDGPGRKSPQPALVRPRTAQGTNRRAEFGAADFLGLVGTSTVTVTAGPSPPLSPTHSPSNVRGLKAFRSEANLNLGMNLGAARNLSSTSLAMPPLPSMNNSGGSGLRPGTAHSMRGFSEQRSAAPAPAPLLLAAPTTKTTTSSDMKQSVVTPTFGPRASALQGAGSLAQFYREAGSLAVSDEASLVDGDAEEEHQESFSAQLAREEKERREQHRKCLEKEAEEEALRRREDARVAEQRRAMIPSPPVSEEGEFDLVYGALDAYGTKSHARPYDRNQDTPPGSRDFCPEKTMADRAPIITQTSYGSFGTVRGEHVSSPVEDDNESRSWEEKTADMREVAPTVDDGQSQQQPTLNVNTEPSRPMERSNSTPPTASPQLLRPQQPARSATAPAPRSPLFQQLSPFDIHSDEEDDDDDNEDRNVDRRAGNAPYGLPTPPFTKRKEDDEEEEGTPVLRNVQAKRDTVLVDGGVNEAVGLQKQIEELEKTVMQMQQKAMERDEPEYPSVRLRGYSSAASSVYSDMADSPMDSPTMIEAPLASPKPFPLSPRPVERGGMRTGASQGVVGDSISSSFGRPSLETRPSLEVPRPSLEVRAESPLGSLRQMAIRNHTPPPPPRRDNSDERPSPSPLRAAIIGATSAPRRPMLGENSNIRINTVAALAGRVRRPSPDEYGVHIRRSESPAQLSDCTPPPQSSPLRRTASPISGEEDAESPIVRENFHRSVMTPPRQHHQYSDSNTTLSTWNTDTDNSRANSPALGYITSNSTASYSVFSPPSQPPGPPRSVNPEWYGPAPTAPPNSPLPIPQQKKSAAPPTANKRTRKNTFELAKHPQPQQQSAPPTASVPTIVESEPTSPTPPMPLSPGGGFTPSPDLENNPYWPLPGPPTNLRDGTGGGGSSGFTARRSTLIGNNKTRAPPAPLNIAATRYAEDVGAMSSPAPWTGGSARNYNHGGSPGYAASPDYTEGEDKSAGIGVARGLSIKYDRVRERERRAREARDLEASWQQIKQGGGGAGGGKDVQQRTLVVARRPDHGMRSPNGVADDQGVRFI